MHTHIQLYARAHKASTKRRPPDQTRHGVTPFLRGVYLFSHFLKTRAFNSSVKATAAATEAQSESCAAHGHASHGR